MRRHGLDAGVGIVLQGGDFDIAQVRFAGKLYIMVEKQPLALDFHNGVVVGPAFHGFEHDAFIGKGAVGIVADGIADVVRVAGRVGEVIFSVVFMEPGGFKKALVVVAFQKQVALFVHDFYFADGFGEAFHVGAHFGHAG